MSLDAARPRHLIGVPVFADVHRGAGFRRGLDVILEGLLPEMDRFFTDYAATDIRDVEVESRPAKLVRGIYRHGRVTVALDQWMTQISRRSWSISASYDRDGDAGFFELANEVIATLRLDVAPR